MIVWQGFGFLAVLIPIALAVLLSIADPSNSLVYGNSTMLALSAAAVWAVGKKLNGAPGRLLIDPVNRQPVLLKNKHTLFWIPMEWFALAWGAGAVIEMVKHFL